MTKTPARDRRRRRVASDEAHAWARDLRLHNPYAKSVLRALALYVNEFGACTPGISTIAEDTDLSDDTVRKRLKFLEDCGAIVRFPRWRDEQGRENTDGRGKRTTDEIRLMIDADTDDIEARARGDEPENGPCCTDDEGEFSPLPQQGLNSEARQVSPVPAPEQPSDSRKGLISEPEPESSPQAPLRGGVELSSDEGVSEPEHFAEFWLGYPGHRVMDRARALLVFSAMSDTERRQARASVPLLDADLTKLKRRPKDAYKWLRDRGFEQYPHAKLLTPQTLPDPVFYPEDGDVVAALRVVWAMTGTGGLRLDWNDDRSQRGVKLRSDFGPDLVALARFKPQDAADFGVVVEEGSNEYGAWRGKLSKWCGREVQPSRIWTEPHNPAVHDLPYSHPDHRFRKFVKGFRVPWDWPPRKDGTLTGEQPDVEGSGE